MFFRAEDVYKITKDAGETLSLKKTLDKGTYNPDTGDIDLPVTAEYNFTGYFYDFDNQNPTEVTRGLHKCAIPGLKLAPGVEPVPGDEIINEAKVVVKIDRVTNIFSNGEKIYYLCDVKA